MLVCRECGAAVQGEQRFCGECGAHCRSDGSVQTCPACGGKVRCGTLYADAELTMVFQDSDQSGEEERFIKAYACVDCGRVRLVVDYETDVEQ